MLKILCDIVIVIVGFKCYIFCNKLIKWIIIGKKIVKIIILIKLKMMCISVVCFVVIELVKLVKIVVIVVLILLFSNIGIVVFKLIKFCW